MTNKRVLLYITYVSFIVHALAGSMLGVAWPSLRQTFGLPLDALGTLLIVIMVGYMLAGLSNGQAIAYLKIGPVLLISWVLHISGLVGYVLAPTWGWFLAGGFALGWGGGMLDAGLNTYMAANHDAREMNWLHASFGLGATMGPLLMSNLLSNESGWRSGYIWAGAFQVVVLAAMIVTLRSWKLNITPEESGQSPRSGSNALRLAVAWIGMLVFFQYAGIEATAGQWSFTLFTESRLIGAQVAGIWVSIYWGSLTVGRLLTGVIVNRLGARLVLRLGVAGMLLGAILLTVRVGIWGFVGLALIGFAAAPIFPLLVLGTPQRVGERHAAAVVGYQIGGASLGLMLQPALAGVMADTWGLEIIGPFLIVMAILTWLAYEWLVFMSKPRPVPHWAQSD